MPNEPIDLLLWCPNCGEDHVDAPSDSCEKCGHNQYLHKNSECMNCPCKDLVVWTNPPHKSHRCSSCNTVWRPCDVPTNGVDEIKTRGENDTWPELEVANG